MTPKLGEVPRQRGGSSTQYFLDDMTMHVCQAAIGAVVEHAQLLVIDSHQVQDRGVNVVAVSFAFGGSPAPLQTCTKRTPRSNNRRASRQRLAKSPVIGSSTP